MLPAEKAEEMTGVERDGDFFLRPKPSRPSRLLSFPSEKVVPVIRRDVRPSMGLGAWRFPGCTAWSGALYPPLDCWGAVWCPPSGDISVAASPPCVFCPDRRKARGARLPMSGFWGEGEFEGEGPLFTAGKRGHPPQSSQPGRSSMKQKWGRLLKRRPHFVSWELSLTPGSEAPVRRAQLRMRPLLPRPIPSCSALNEGRCVGRAFPRASGEGSLRRGPLVTAGKRGPSSSTYLCLRPALPWWPGRSAVPRWWG